MKPADELFAKPLLRGWSHAAAALVAIAGLVVLILITRHDTAKLVSMVVYGTALVLLFSVSATYHIFNWPPRVKDWLRRADHATIFIFIAAGFTAIWGVILGAPTLRLRGLYLALATFERATTQRIDGPVHQLRREFLVVFQQNPGNQPAIGFG